MSVASMVQSVMIPRKRTGSCALLAAAGPPGGAAGRTLTFTLPVPRTGAACAGTPERGASEEVRKVPLMPGVDARLDAHAGAQRRIALLVLHTDADRDALHHLHPVARSVLRRKDGELRAAVGRDAVHHALPGAAGIGIDTHLHRIARLDPGELGFLRIGLHPHIFGGDDAEGGG